MHAYIHRKYIHAYAYIHAYIYTYTVHKAHIHTMVPWDISLYAHPAIAEIRRLRLYGYPAIA